jgi:hypothetical protein
VCRPRRRVAGMRPARAGGRTPRARGLRAGTAGPSSTRWLRAATPQAQRSCHGGLRAGTAGSSRLRPPRASAPLRRSAGGRTPRARGLRAATSQGSHEASAPAASGQEQPDLLPHGGLRPGLPEPPAPAAPPRPAHAASARLAPGETSCLAPARPPARPGRRDPKQA